MSNKNTNGKGDKFRPTNLKEYRNNYDEIFGKKFAKRIYRELDKSGQNPDYLSGEENEEEGDDWNDLQENIDLLVNKNTKLLNSEVNEKYIKTKCCNLDTDNDGNCPIHPEILDKTDNNSHPSGLSGEHDVVLDAINRASLGQED